ncbi:MAG: hypothetical protein ACLFV3_10740 [Phycisphaeraceae bacterium]
MGRKTKFTQILSAAAASAVLAGLVGGEALAQEKTVVRLTDEVKVEDTSRLGMHLGGDTHHDAPVLKKRVMENFEGTIYRQIHVVEFEEPNVVIGDRLGHKWPGWVALWEGGEFVVVNGPDQWKRGKIVKAEDTGQGTRFVLDQPVEPHPEETAIMFQNFRLEEGALRQGPRDWFKRGEFGHTGNISDSASFSNDTAEDSFGHSSLKLPAGGEAVFPAAWTEAMDTRGTWHVQFRVKAAQGNPTVTYGLGEGEHHTTVQPESTWQQVEHVFEVSEEQNVEVTIQPEGGDILIDDVVAWKAGDENPTAFRDVMVEALEKYNPGVMRLLSNGGNGLLNAIRPPLEAYADRGVPYGSIKRNPIGVHDFYGLCEYVGADAWAVIPPTLTPEEIDQYMEYIGAPADTGYGKLRAELGHPEPWTESLNQIFVQFGNEAITFPLSSYNGPDYWTDLIDRAKKSPYYKENVKFVIDQQPTPWRVLKYTENADRLSMNNYLLFTLENEELERLDTDEKFFKYVFAWGYNKWMNQAVEGKYSPMTMARDEPIEVVIYEGGNYHLTHGDAPAEPRNRVTTGLGGGVNAINSKLLIMKEYGVRTQNLFTFTQFDFTGGGSFGSGVTVRVWGQVTNMRPDDRRYRPAFLAGQVANEVIGGDLVQTVHEGADPTFDATGLFEWSWTDQHPEPTTVEDVPTIYSYGFQEGDRRGLILVSLAVNETHPVEIQFDGQATGEADRWVLTADAIDASNEPEHEVQVRPQHEKVEGFKSGHTLDLPPHSMIVYEWDVAE